MTITIPVWVVQAIAVALFVALACGAVWLALEMAWTMGKSGMAFTQLFGDYIRFVQERRRRKAGGADA